MAEDDPAFGFFASTLDRVAQLLHDSRVEAVALVRAVKADERDLTIEFVGDCLLFAHDFSWFDTSKSERFRRPPSEHLVHDLHADLHLHFGEFDVAATLRRGIAKQ